MSIPNIVKFQLEMQSKLEENRHKKMISKQHLLHLLNQQHLLYLTTENTKHLINMANYCAMIWNKEDK